jgi:hypothetical protein
MIRLLQLIVTQLVLFFVLSLSGASPGWAETTAQSVHWGAIAFPDHDRTLALGLTADRFTEFDGAGQRYNDIRETAGFNFFSLSWTERLARYPGWNTNLTVGAGPTQDGFSRFLQNDVVHKLRGLTRVPVGATRNATDVMISGTLTKWTGLLGSEDVFFYGVGGAAGSLYYEPYAQLGFRRLSVLPFLPIVSDYVRMSAMARLGRPFSGAAYREVSAQSYLAQASLGIGNYRRCDADIPWEIEVAATVDSGLFVDHRGHSLEERFASVALHLSAVTFETWNDLINQKDYGPTFGARLTLDLLYLYDHWYDRHSFPF